MYRKRYISLEDELVFHSIHHKDYGEHGDESGDGKRRKYREKAV